MQSIRELIDGRFLYDKLSPPLRGLFRAFWISSGPRELFAHTIAVGDHDRGCIFRLDQLACKISNLGRTPAGGSLHLPRSIRGMKPRDRSSRPGPHLDLDRREAVFGILDDRLNLTTKAADLQELECCFAKPMTRARKRWAMRRSFPQRDLLELSCSLFHRGVAIVKQLSEPDNDRELGCRFV